MDKRMMVGTVSEHVYGGQRAAEVWVGAKYDAERRLSISGVVGPRPNGDAWGSCGQIEDTLEREDFAPADGWTAETVARLLEVWRRWHLNDMRAGCEHQRALGWNEKGRQEVTQYNWRLSSKLSERQRGIERRAMKQLREFGRAEVDDTERQILNLDYDPVTWTDLPPAVTFDHEGPAYEPARPLYAGGRAHEERKTLGWLRPEEHPEGIMCRPCPECGYKYGSAWKREEVPADVLAFLESLPKASKPCPWGSL